MNDKELDLNILENADDDETMRIAALNSISESDKERMFNISRNIYNKKINSTETAPAMEVSGVEQYKKPVWYKIISAAAALVLTAGAVTGGVFLWKNNRTVPPESTENETTLTTEESTVSETTTENVTTLPTEAVTGNDKISLYTPVTDSFIECEPDNIDCSLYNFEDDTIMSFANKDTEQLVSLFNSFEFEEVEPWFKSDYFGRELAFLYTPDNDFSDPYNITIYENGIISNSKRSTYKYYQIGEENARKLIDMADEKTNNIRDNLSPDLFFKLHTPVSADITCSITDSETHTLSNEDLDSLIKLLTAPDLTYPPIKDLIDDSSEREFEINIELQEDNFKMYHIWFFKDNTIYCLYSGNAARRVYQVSPEIYEAAKKLYDKYYTS